MESYNMWYLWMSFYIWYKIHKIFLNCSLYQCLILIMNRISLCGENTFYLLIDQLMDIWIISTLACCYEMVNISFGGHIFLLFIQTVPYIAIYMSHTLIYNAFSHNLF